MGRRIMNLLEQVFPDPKKTNVSVEASILGVSDDLLSAIEQGLISAGLPELTYDFESLEEQIGELIEPEIEWGYE